MIELAYGKSTKTVRVPDHHLMGVLYPQEEGVVDQDGREMVLQALKNPFNSRGLKELALQKQAGNAVIVVNDITRPTPYQEILPPILDALHEAGLNKEAITLLIATGIHRPQTTEENRAVFGEEICRSYRIVNHNCDENLRSIGRLSNGMDLKINREAAEADLLVTTGLVGLHYFAGYSGGRKSILPGIASRQVIEANHKMMDDPRARLGNYRNNPVSDLMVEGARLAGVDFIVNVVTGQHQKIVYAAAGDLLDAWLDAVLFAEQMSVLSLEARADIVIAACGGYPKDLNMYQAQKALDAAALAVKEGGSIVLIAECAEGLGEKTFEEWVMAASCPQDIEQRFRERFELGGHKAYAICRTLRNTDIFLMSSLPADLVEKLFLKPVDDLEETLAALLEQYGPQAEVLVMPEAPRTAVRVRCEE